VILDRLQSLRARLLLGVVAGMVVLQVASSLAVYSLAQRALIRRFDQAITSTARALAAQVKYDKAKGLHVDLDTLPMPEFQRPRGPDYFQVWGPDGTVVARSQTLGGDDLARAPSADKPVRYDCMLPRRESGRAVLLTVGAQQKGPPHQRDPPQMVTIVVAKETEPVRNDLRALAWILMATLVAGAVVAGGLAWTVVTHGLRPLHRVAQQISQVEPSALGQRIDPSGLPAELQPVAARLNTMLNRLQAAFERERGFTADVAHEFRNPLAAMRSIGEVAMASPQSADEYLKDIAEMVALARGMQAMVEKLLLLARLDAGQVPVERSRVDLGAMVAAELAARRRELDRKHVSVASAIPDHYQVEGADPQLLSLVVANIIDNAVAYVDAGGRICIEGEAGVITVQNTGCGLSPQEAARVFDRFWRGDPSRSATGNHAGLGLSLAQRAVVAMGGGIEAAVHDATFIVRVHLPA